MPILKRALVYIRKGWVKNTWAKDSYDIDVDPTDNHAVCWCATGALIRAASELGAKSEELCFDALRAAIPKKDIGLSIAGFNDAKSTNQNDIIKLFERAIKASRPTRKISSKRPRGNVRNVRNGR